MLQLSLLVERRVKSSPKGAIAISTYLKGRIVLVTTSHKKVHAYFLFRKALTATDLRYEVPLSEHLKYVEAALRLAPRKANAPKSEATAKFGLGYLAVEVHINQSGLCHVAFETVNPLYPDGVAVESATVDEAQLFSEWQIRSQLKSITRATR